MSNHDNAIDDGEKAFLRSAGLGGAHIQWRSTTFPDDMTLLDWFAGQASEKDIDRHASLYRDENKGNSCTREHAKYLYAAAMIAEKRRLEECETAAVRAAADEAEAIRKRGGA